jgi:hypothetical protein
MSHDLDHAMEELLNAVSAERHYAVLALAAVSLMNGSASDELRVRTLGVAQDMGVSNSEYLRARLLLQSSVLND